MPGALPVLNEECLNHAIKAGIALQGEINSKIMFERKHYFDSDTPPGY